MTPEEIKKIAEEYAIFYDGIDIQPRVSQTYVDAEELLRWLSKRFYLVEKSKVEEMYPHYDNFNTFNRGVCYCLRTLFGPDIRKEEEE